MKINFYLEYEKIFLKILILMAMTIIANKIRKELNNLDVDNHNRNRIKN